ncbi:MAG: 2OG-Fe(II) oxygenase [Acidihalobacter sp.]|uniref:2OG-Fe(II) oxygenase n=1 Tax=Acidihalobacter sp. TaxID=1872108 RepID=UPI00307D6F54
MSTLNAYLEISDALCGAGWISLQHFLEPKLVEALHAELLAHMRSDALTPALIGRGPRQQLREDIRGDRTRWLTGAGEAQRLLFEHLKTLRTTLNRTLFIGLEDFEAHYALYPPGARYQRHIDSFRGDNLRRVSLVLYLNPHWRRHDGGLLRLYTPKGALIEEVMPEAGRAVCFLSEEFPHEVTQTRRPRASIACWFRIRPVEAL